MYFTSEQTQLKGAYSLPVYALSHGNIEDIVCVLVIMGIVLLSSYVLLCMSVCGCKSFFLIACIFFLNKNVFS